MIIKVMISVISPCFNEESILPSFLEALEKIMKNSDHEFELILVDNNSSDSTWEKMKLNEKKFKNIKLIKFSNYFGKEAAILAGIDNCKGEAAIIIDPDLEDPPELITEMIDKWKKGYDVVLTQRSSEDVSYTKKILKSFF